MGRNGGGTAMLRAGKYRDTLGQLNRKRSLMDVDVAYPFHQ
jgi:hypothetical protein